MSPRIVLGLSAAIWLPYGLYCFFAPDALAAIAGVASNSTTGSIELRAMYGGLQLSIGALALAGLLRASLQRPALRSTEQVSTLDYRAHKQGAGRVAQVYDHPEAPAPPAQVAWPAEEHLGQEDVNFGEEG